MNQQPPWYNQPTQINPGQFQQPPYNPPPRNSTGIWAWYKTRSRKAKIGLGCVMVRWFLLFFSCIGTAIGSSHLATLATPATTLTPTATSVQAAELMSPTATMESSPTRVPTQQPTPTPT